MKEYIDPIFVVKKTTQKKVFFVLDAVVVEEVHWSGRKSEEKVNMIVENDF